MAAVANAIAMNERLLAALEACIDVGPSAHVAEKEKESKKRGFLSAIGQHPQAPPSPPPSPTLHVPPLDHFVSYLIRKARVATGELLLVCLYLDRLRIRFERAGKAKGLPCTRHRIFLATLIIATKFSRDQPTTAFRSNRQWAECTRWFSLADVNLMERQLLALLGWHLLPRPGELDEIYAQIVGAGSSLSMPWWERLFKLSSSTETNGCGVAVSNDPQLTIPADVVLTTQADTVSLYSRHSTPSANSIHNSSQMTGYFNLPAMTPRSIMTPSTPPPLTVNSMHHLIAHEQHLQIPQNTAKMLAARHHINNISAEMVDNHQSGEDGGDACRTIRPGQPDYERTVQQIRELVINCQGAGDQVQ